MILGALALSVAHADVIPPGTTVRVTAVGRKDAFWRYRSTLVGLRCVVIDPGLVAYKGRWYGGPLACEDDEVYYFYQVTVEQGDFGGALPKVEPVPAKEPVASLDEPRPEVYTPWPKGGRVRIRAISEVDAHYPDRAQLLGKECTITDPLAPTGDTWLSGGLDCGVGTELFFYQVGVDGISGVTSGAPAGAAQGETLEAGRLVRVLAVGSADQHYEERDKLVGHLCSVLSAPLVPSGEGWYAGRLFCDDGGSWQLFQVAVKPEVAAKPEPTPSPLPR